MRRQPIVTWVCVGMLLIVGVLVGAGPARGQAMPGMTLGPEESLASLAEAPAQLVEPEEPRTFGTADEAVVVISPTEFQVQKFGGSPIPDWAHILLNNATTGAWVRGNSGFTAWAAGVHVPSGAEVTRLQISACDVSNTDELRFALIRVNEPQQTGAVNVTPFGTTGVGAAPGCGLFSVTPSSPVIIDNANNAYAVALIVDSGPLFSSARVFYRLRISPAPASATFGDVPTSHIFFQFIEALVDAGITAGCGGGNYCPDDPVTRGQMAVFISRALGLHFAP